jgi:hypothetical protein
LLAALVAVLASAMVPSVASAGPEPGAKKRGFRLFARALGAMTINRVYCGLASAGQICVDSTNSSTIGGGFWPKGTADQYVFNSGLQIAGVIGANGGPWANDTVGGFFFDPKGTTEHGEQVQPIYNASNPEDLNAWPEAACVPFGDASQELFDDLLVTDSTNTDPAYSYRCRKSASQGDVWFMSWEGNTGLRAGRKHPLGIVAEQRGMGWNFPVGNEDIIYFIYTFYNVTSLEEADYAQHRASIRPILLQKAQDLHAGAASLGADLPDAGYTINNMFAAFAADMDVGDAGSNYASVNLPFALGYTYDHGFSQAPGWTFDPSLFSAPFFPGAGFIGVKYLKSPTGAGEIQLFGNTVNGTPFAGAVNDPRDVPQLYRYLSGTLSPATGDQPCNTGVPSVTRICFVNNTASADMRFFQSSTPLSLEPGQSGSIVVAYIFAAPVAITSCTGACGDVKPGDATRLTDPVRLATGANQVDSLSGFRGWQDRNGDGVVQQNEFTTVKGSLLGKATVAQSVFDNAFLLPFAPAAVEFFLIPGDNQVTVIWKPTSSETSGDPFFSIASRAQVPDPETGVLVNNPLYDPNYREFDVEGYRIYRGRVDAPNELTLLAQYDYAGTVISDFTGIVNPTVGCAPEFAIEDDCLEDFAPNLKNGVTLTVSHDYDLVGDIVQVQAGSGRTALANGEALVLRSDTAVVGGGTTGTCGPRQACSPLVNNGVPFVYIDRTPRNNFRYFYSVTAFDVNSIESGPTSLESPRNTRAVRPVRPASNYSTSSTLTSEVYGRGVLVSNRPAQTIDPANGTFSGPSQPGNAMTLAFAGELASNVVGSSGSLRTRLLSVRMGQVELSGCCAGGSAGIPAQYVFRVFTASDSFDYTYSLVQAFDHTVEDNRNFAVLNLDPTLAGGYGGDSSFQLFGQQVMRVPASSEVGDWGTGPALAGAGLGRYNGDRWFVGPSPANNETFADPTRGNCGAGAAACNAAQGGAITTFVNAGSLGDGVQAVYQPRGYVNFDREWRNIGSSIASVYRAADFNVYWGAAGVVDSVIDVTHNVVVPFEATNVGGGWGILNHAATAGATNAQTADGRAAVLTPLDWTCVEPFRSTLTQPTNTFFPCTSPAAFQLSNTAVPGPIAFNSGPAGSATGARVVAARPNNGFSIYIAGSISMFELTGGAVPASGTVWTLRTYAGRIQGGKGGQPGNLGNYVFQPSLRPFTAIGAELAVNYSVTNTLAAASGRSLRAVHTVPDPYYVTNGYEQTTDTKILKFVNLPTQAIIRIYSSSGVLVNVIEHPGPNCQNVNLNGDRQDPAGGECTWNVRNRNNQVVASGVYFYHIESNFGGGTGRRVGRMTVVNFAQ